MRVARVAQGGTTLIGFIAGLVLGLVIAVCVAMYITKTPIPFINKLGHPPDAPLPEAGRLPDPNRSLYTHDASGSDGSLAPTSGTSAPSITVSPPANPPQSAAQASGTKSQSTATVATAAKPGAAAVDPSESFIQAGAFHSLDDAESMKGKLALLGFEAVVSNSDRDGGVVYRVRLGPYKLDDLNRVRQRLIQNNVEASVVPAAKANQ